MKTLSQRLFTFPCPLGIIVQDLKKQRYDMRHLIPYFKKYKLQSILAPLFKMLEACFDLAVSTMIPLMMTIVSGFIYALFIVLGLIYGLNFNVLIRLIQNTCD